MPPSITTSPSLLLVRNFEISLQEDATVPINRRPMLLCHYVAIAIETRRSGAADNGFLEQIG